MNNQPDTQHTKADSIGLKLRGFKVYAVDLPGNRIPPYTRRDFYKIVLSAGHLVVHQADQSLDLPGYNYPTCFNNFFRKMTATPAKSFRA